MMKKLLTLVAHAVILFCSFFLLLTSCEIEDYSDEMPHLNGNYTVDKVTYEVLIDGSWVPLMILDERFEKENGIKDNKLSLRYLPEDKKSYLLYIVKSNSGKEPYAGYIIEYVNGIEQKTIRTTDSQDNLDNLFYLFRNGGYFNFDYGRSLMVYFHEGDLNESDHIGDIITFTTVYEFAHNGQFKYEGKVKDSNGETRVGWIIQNGVEYERVSKNAFNIYRPLHYLEDPKTRIVFHFVKIK